MTRLLYVKASPRGAASRSVAIADAYLEAALADNPDLDVDILSLWDAALPEFDGDTAASKMSFFGEAGMTDKQKAIYAELVRLFEQFNAADEYLFAIPMWNFGVPYKLKQYIDLLSMPGTLFGFDPASGYAGLLKGKRAAAVYSAAVYHDGASKAFGVDHVSTYFNDWLHFAGIDDVATVWFQKYKMMSAGDAEAAFETAGDQARAAARRPRR